MSIGSLKSCDLPVSQPSPEPVSFPVQCGNCGRAVTLDYVPGQRSVPVVYFCPYCHKPARLELPGQLRGVSKAENERF